MPNQYEIFSELCADHSSWENTRNYPSTRVCRNMLVLADFASENPMRWRTIQLLLECPDLSYRETALVLEIPLIRVYRHALPEEIGGEIMTMPGAGREILQNTHESGAIFSLTARRALRLAAFAAAEPLRWQLLRCAYRGETPPTRRRLAELFRISPARVTRLLRVPHLGYPEDFFPDGISGDIPSEKYRYVF